MEVEAARVFAEVAFPGDREEFSTFSLYRFGSSRSRDEPLLRHYTGIQAWMDDEPVDDDDDDDIQNNNKTATATTTATATASVRIVFMRRKPGEYTHHRWAFNTTEPIFQSIWSACRLDESLKYLVWSQLYGLHTASPIASVTTTPTSFYLHVSGTEMLVWSYDARTRATRALCMSGEIHLYAAQLKQQADLIIHPACLALLRTMRQTSAHLRRFSRDRTEIQDLEGSSGSVWWSSPDGPEMNPDLLGRRSREAGKFLERLLNTALITSNFLDLCSTLSEDGWATAADHLPDMQRRAEYTNCHAKIVQSIAMMRSCLAVTHREVLMYQERTKTLMTVNLHLINKADVDAAKRDSSSMKTIAVMTMAFLPATFFAAFFSMPMFQWEDTSSTVIRPRFWVYWVFTVPCTLAVFVLWATVTQRQALVDFVYAAVEKASSRGEKAKSAAV